MVNVESKYGENVILRKNLNQDVGKQYKKKT